MTEQEEVRLYHIICDISKICKDYFYARKYLPNDAWSLEGVINDIGVNSRYLKKQYVEIKKNNKLKGKEN